MRARQGEGRGAEIGAEEKRKRDIVLGGGEGGGGGEVMMKTVPLSCNFLEVLFGGRKPRRPHTYIRFSRCGETRALVLSLSRSLLDEMR